MRFSFLFLLTVDRQSNVELKKTSCKRSSVRAANDGLPMIDVVTDGPAAAAQDLLFLHLLLNALRRLENEKKKKKKEKQGNKEGQ